MFKRDFVKGDRLVLESENMLSVASVLYSTSDKLGVELPSYQMKLEKGQYTTVRYFKGGNIPAILLKVMMPIMSGFSGYILQKVENKNKPKDVGKISDYCVKVKHIKNPTMITRNGDINIIGYSVDSISIIETGSTSISVGDELLMTLNDYAVLSGTVQEKIKNGGFRVILNNLDKRGFSELIRREILSC